MYHVLAWPALRPYTSAQKLQNSHMIPYAVFTEVSKTVLDHGHALLRCKNSQLLCFSRNQGAEGIRVPLRLLGFLQAS